MDSVKLSQAIMHGDWRTRVSFLVSGFGCLTRKQYIKGILYLGIQILFWVFFFTFSWQYLKDIGTLGTQGVEKVWDEAQQIYIRQQGDNSMIILLYSVISFFVVVAVSLVHLMNIKSAYALQVTVKECKRPPTFLQDLRDLFDRRLHTTLLGLPAIGVLAFTVLPILFMICIAFTNFDQDHQPPGNLFTWVGFENFAAVFSGNAQKTHTFLSLLGWTLIWAVCATGLNYIFGMIIAMLINKKGIRGKSIFRTCFVMSIAVPGFVTLLFMRQLLADQGAVNVLLQNWGLIESPIKFLSDPTLARITVIVVNLWIGIPYTILITSGILMNIPADLYEAAHIDGAGPVRQFRSITLPYMLFITAPYLITQFVGNINNFNAIYFLTRGDPSSTSYFQAGETDLLVTWLYKLTVNFGDYNLASVIGIMVFIICAALSLATFNVTSSRKKEGTFQ